MKNDNIPEPGSFRQKAEDELKKRFHTLPDNLPVNSQDPELLKYIHELEVHQIEIEIQHEELLRAQSAAQDAIDPYDYAPTGYFILSREGEIYNLNLTGSQILGKERSHLKSSRFGFFVSNDSKPDFNSFLENLFRSKTKETCEVSLIINGKLPLFVHLDGVVTEDGEQCLVTLADITERKRSEDAIRERELHYSDIFQTISEGIIRTTSTGHVLSINKSFEQIMDLPKDEIIGKNLLNLAQDYLSPESRNAALPYLRNLTRGKKNQAFQIEHKNRIIEVDATISKQSGLLTGILRDTTELRKSEAELEESREKYRGLSEAAFESIFISEKGVCIEQNQTAEKMFGYTSEEAIGRYGTEWIAPQDREMVMQNMLKGHEDPYEAMALKKDGTTFPCILRGKMMHYKGRTVRVTSLSDNTHRKKAEVALQESEAKFKAIIETIPLAIYFSTGVEQICEYMNPKFTELFGYTLEDIPTVEKWWPLAYPDENYRKQAAEDWTKKVRQAIETQSHIEPVEVVVTSRDGSRKNILWGYITLGEKNYAYGLDITARKTVEDALRESESGLDNAERMAKIGNWIVIASNPSAPEKLYWSKEMYRIANRDPKSFTPTLAAQMDLLVPEDARKLAEAVACSMKTSEPYDIELQLKDEEGRDAKWIRSHSEMVYDEKGRINGMRGTAQDITERKQAEEKLRLKNYVFDVSIAAKSIADINGIITEANDSFLRVWGYAGKNEVLGKPITFFIKDPDAAITILTTLNNTGEWEGNFIAMKKDSSTFTAHGLATVVKDKNGKIIAYQSSAIDITESKLAEQKLKVSEQLYRNLFDQANEGLILLTMDGKIAEVNQSFAMMHGYTVSELKNMDIRALDVLRENAFEGRAEIMHRIYAGEVVRFEVEHYHKDGHIITFSDTVSIINIGGQKFFSAFHQDITERKQVEEKLLFSEKTLKESQKIAGLGTFDLDILRGIFRTSDILNEIFGIDEKYDHSISGWSALIYPEDREMTVNHLMNEVIGNMQPGNIEFRIVRYNDKITRWMHVLGKLEFDADGHPIILHGTARDITEQKQVESELIRAKEKAEESDRLKSAFLANMSHEIRTPMNAILGFSNLLKEPHLSDGEQQEYIKLIEKGGERMLNIIHNIVDISKIESRQMEVYITDTDVNENIEFLYSFYKKEASLKGIQIFCKNALPKNEAVIKTDRKKLYSALSNLVKNAIQYTSEGSIEFGYEKKGKTLEFFVKDTGSGVPEQYKELIFERFRQGNDLTRKFTEGAGLGLSISKAYIELLGGKMWLESEHGKGSIFYFTLPYNPANKKDLADKDDSTVTGKYDQFKNLKILIVEDYGPSLAFLSKVLAKHCKEILTSSSGAKAVEVCRINADIDLVLMDIKLPDLDGYEATRQIRQFNKDVIIIAQTAFGLTGDREKAIEAGCNDYISKPIIIDKLFPLIIDYCKSKKT